LYHKSVGLLKVKKIRIYQPGDYKPGQRIELSPEACQHVGVVLRMKPGGLLTLFNGDNLEFLATIEEVKKKQVFVRIDSVAKICRESPLTIHLAQAISKGDRMEFVMQKAVELGVSSIIPIISQRCVVVLDKERLTKKTTQWQAIVISACEQSGRNIVPTVHQPLNLEQYLNEAQGHLKLVLDPKGNKSWRDYDIIKKEITLLIGPEGGLNDDEIKLALNQGFQSLSLGPRILRTETAAITALSVLQAVAGDL
jgi:16S rRNA (uracil1498-N3)-methyltransferase